MKGLLLGIALLYWNAIALCQDNTTVGSTPQSGESGFPCVGSFSNLDGISSETTTDYTRFSALAGINCTYYLHASLQEPAEAGTFAGFRIATSNLATLLASVTIETYRNGSFVEASTSGSLIQLITAGVGPVFFQTTKPYDAIRIVFRPGIEVLSETRIYFGFASPHNPAKPLPLKITAERVVIGEKVARLSWSILKQEAISSIEVQRSINGSSFQTIATLPVSSWGDYEYTDYQTAPHYTYRIKVIENGNTVYYSKVLMVTGRTVTAYLVLSNPMSTSNVIRVNMPQAGKYTLIVRDSDGRVLQQKTLLASSTLSLHSSALSKGLYSVSLYSADGQLLDTKRFLLQ